MDPTQWAKILEDMDEEDLADTISDTFCSSNPLLTASRNPFKRRSKSVCFPRNSGSSEDGYNVTPMTTMGMRRTGGRSSCMPGCALLQSMAAQSLQEESNFGKTKRIKRKKARPVHPMLAAVIAMPALPPEVFMREGGEEPVPPCVRRCSGSTSSLRDEEADEARTTIISRTTRANTSRVLLGANEAPRPEVQKKLLNVTSVGEAKLDVTEDDDLLAMQRRTLMSHGRAFPLGVRTDSSNMDAVLGWRAGLQMVALNLQTNDLQTQLHYALFELDGGHGYVLKPKEMRTGEPWPPARETLRRVSFKVISLHHLPARGEVRPFTAGGRHAACHAFESSLSVRGGAVPPKASAAGVVSPSIQLELYAIGGFCCISDCTQPEASKLQTRYRTRSVDGNGLAAEFGQTVHCLAAEPRETVLRVVVFDGEAEVAYETAVLGALRSGYRCFQLRHMRTGTRIELCSLLVHIEIAEEPHLWAGKEVMQVLLEKQQAINEEQKRELRVQQKRIEELVDQLEATLQHQAPQDPAFQALTPTSQSHSSPLGRNCRTTKRFSFDMNELDHCLGHESTNTPGTSARGSQPSSDYELPAGRSNRGQPEQSVAGVPRRRAARNSVDIDGGEAQPTRRHSQSEITDKQSPSIASVSGSPPRRSFCTDSLECSVALPRSRHGSNASHASAWDQPDSWRASAASSFSGGQKPSCIRAVSVSGIPKRPSSSKG